MTAAAGQPERTTQDRIIALFRDDPHYRYLGDWTDHPGNSNIEQGLRSGTLTPSCFTNWFTSWTRHMVRGSLR